MTAQKNVVIADNKSDTLKATFTLSLVVPCYNEQSTLPIFYKTFQTQLPRLISTAQSHHRLLQYELIIVNDGSTDDTKQVAVRLAQEDRSVKVFNFSRNFGKEAAILCGLEKATGDCVVLLDADGQDPLEMINEMLVHWFSGVQIVYTKRVDRKGEGFIRSILSKAFYRLSNFMSTVALEPNVRDFTLMDRVVVNAIIGMREYHRFSKAIFRWVGFTRLSIEYKNIKRNEGDSAWGLGKLVSYAMDGIISFSSMPLRIAFFMGLFVSLISGIYGVYRIVDTLIFGNPVAGYPSLITVISFLGGLQLLVLGVIGEYIARIYEQGKHRPIYILDDKMEIYHNEGGGVNNVAFCHICCMLSCYIFPSKGLNFVLKNK